MKRIVTILVALIIVCGVWAQTDMRCVQLQGHPLEGPIDSVRNQLLLDDWTEWGHSDDGEDFYFRGKYYGIRAKLAVSISPSSKLLTSAFVSVGPYSTERMLNQNLQYFLHKLKEHHGDFVQRNGAWVYMDDFASVKLSVVDNENGSKDIRVFYLPMATYYKDAISMGLHGAVQEIVTENAVAEDQFLHFSQDGQIENPDLIQRHYNRYGYLVEAQMTEQEGYSKVTYEYDNNYRLIRRTLINDTAAIKYINEYTYNEIRR